MSKLKYYRRVIRIRAQDSPNVRLALAEIAAGKEPSGTELVPNLLTYEEYLHRLATWDPVRKCIGLDAEFWEGAEVLLYPPEWLNRAEHIADRLLKLKRDPKLLRAIGIDPAEGGDRTSMTAVDRLGILEQVSRKTPDTSVIVDEAIAFMRKWDVEAERVVFDRGGGGYQHANWMRRKGYHVRTVSFGESIALDPKRGLRRTEEKIENREQRYAYTNRRSQMYGDLRELLDPASEADGLPGFGIPAQYKELRRQLSLMPLIFDSEGRLRMLPKNRRTPNSTEKTLTDILGCSPDEADSTVLAVHGLLYKAARVKVGVFKSKRGR